MQSSMRSGYFSLLLQMKRVNFDDESWGEN